MYCKDMNIQLKYDITPEFNQNDQQMTVSQWIQNYNFQVPNEWKINSEVPYYDNQLLTFLAYNEDSKVVQLLNESRLSQFLQAKLHIVPELKNHKPDEQDHNGQTVAMILADNKIKIPSFWYHNPELKDKNGNTVAMIIAKTGQMPDKIWQHKPQMKNNDDNTAAMLLASKGIIPPQQWYHKTFLQNKESKTVAMLLTENGIIPPKEWNHPAQMCDEDGYTVAMNLAINRIIPPQQWIHDADIQNVNKQTVALFLSKNGIIPDSCWYHDPTLQNEDNLTVALNLLNNKIIPPEQWCYDPHQSNDNDETIMQKIIKNKLIPRYYILEKTDNINMCICELQSAQIPIPSEQQETNPTIFDQAMIKQIPDINGHNPNEQNEDGWTVAMILAFQGILAPKQWLHDNRIKNNYDQTYKEMLSDFNQIEYNDKLITNCYFEKQNDVCQICFTEGEQQFIQTTCGHKLCQDCFNNLKVENKYKCPICKREKYLKRFSDKIIDEFQNTIQHEQK